MNNTVYDSLKEMISSGQIKPGVPLVQRELAKKLGTTTTPVREALKSLEAEGLIGKAEGRNSLQLKELKEKDYYERGIMRRAIESEAARLCAKNATEAELVLIKELGEKCDKALAEEELTLEERGKLDMKFHYCIIKGSRCSLLEKEFLSLQLLIRTSCLAVGNNNPGRIIENHVEIADCLLKRDEENAVKAIQKHIDRVINDNLNYLRKKEMEDKISLM